MSMRATTLGETNLTLTGGSEADVLAVLPPNTTVDVLSVSPDWIKVRPAGYVSGFVRRESLLCNDETYLVQSGQALSASLTLENDILPAAARPEEVIAWLSSGAKPPWIPVQYWDVLTPELQEGTERLLHEFFKAHSSKWNAWIAEVQKEGRIHEAIMDEFLTLLRGGKAMWALWADKFYQEPSTESASLGWINPNDVLTWTGRVKKSHEQSSYPWYEVTTVKFEKSTSGWLKNTRILDEYIPSTAENDPGVEENAERVFDLEQRLLRFPQDAEIQEALQKGFNAAQYIDLKALFKTSVRHYNLCGEFCVAALAGSDVIPACKIWLEKYGRAKEILRDPSEGTGINDLLSFLGVFHLKTEKYDSRQVEDRLAFLSPRRLKEKLRQGYRFIAGVTIKGTGRIHAEGTIRHWVVVQDALPVANSGWIRIYNPFQNGDEVYSYRTFSAAFNAFGNKSGVGLWVKTG